MKQIRLLVVAALMLSFLGCSEKPTVEELQKFRATETFPDDTFLDTVANKRALIVVAHDDDDCGMAGTIARLKAAGWQVQQMSLTTHAPADKNAGHPATIISEGNVRILEDGLYRNGLDTMKLPYMPITRKEMEKQFLKDKISTAVVAKVNAFGPSVIFSLDNEMGGYGHPEHIYMSQLVLDLFRSKQIKAQRIYQSVYTDHMEKEIVDIWLYNRMKKYNYPSPNEAAKKLYNLDGMPQPNVQVKISDHAEAKMQYLLAYDEDVRKNLRKFIPYYEEFDAKTYFSVFDYEFFRTIE